ncbi:MAG: polysaccharide biosynthesis tyrosine autokinase [Bacteroidaceae bacterium]|nr:polysaccharide biosynthesis tyrosine autokinase [Bacteroidaceae bacterium]
MNSENIDINKYEEESGFDFKEILTKLLIYWKWFVVSIFLCVACAVLYLKYVTPEYLIHATIMINDEKKGSFQNQMMAMQDFGFMGTTGGIDNEIEILRSKSMIKQAVLDMGIYTIYQVRGSISQRVIYGEYPIEVQISDEDLEKLTRGIVLEISSPDSTEYMVECRYRDEEGELIEFEKRVPTLPYVLESPVGQLILSKGTIEFPKEKTLVVSIVPPIKMARSCLANLSIAPTSKTTSVANISYVDVNKKRGVDFVNSLVAAYNRENNNDKNLVAMKTEDFIKERLDLVAAELDATEYEMAQYKKNSGLTTVIADAQKMLEASSEYEKKSVEIATQLNLITYLRDYVNNPANRLQAIPGNVGLTDVSLTSLIGKYNESIVERNRMLRTASESNPAVIDITMSAELLAETIKTSIESLYASLTIQQRDIERQTAKFDTKKSDAPTQEKVLMGYERQQEVKSGLYLMLLQKREENSIALAATADNAKIIDAALANDRPISPKRSMVLLVALVMGCAIPVVVIYLMELLRYKIEGRNDLEKLTKVPVLGDVAISHNLKKGQRGIVVHENDNNTMTETFRAIRTNLQFVLDSSDKKVIQFTSTTSGEGKTFISSNLAMSMALLGKKVILVGLDIRKPRLAEMFGFSNRQKGITSFLAGDADDKELLFNQIIPSGISDNLDILPAGIVPPNPAELLSKINLDNAVKFLSERYDYVLLDTAPVGLVTDTLIIARVADASVYVCRADYTAKNDLNLVNSLYAEGKLKNMSLVLNGVDMTKRKYGYYYGYGNYGKYGRYGYGKYGHYGHYGYGNDSEKK